MKASSFSQGEPFGTKETDAGWIMDESRTK